MPMRNKHVGAPERGTNRLKQHPAPVYHPSRFLLYES